MTTPMSLGEAVLAFAIGWAMAAAATWSNESDGGK